MSEKKLSEIQKRFNVALVFLLKKKGRGAQADLCRKTRLNPGYVSSIVKGGSASDKAIEQIADYLNTSFEDMLSLGRWILEGKAPEEWFSTPHHLLNKGFSEMTKEEARAAMEYLKPEFEKWLQCESNKKNCTVKSQSGEPETQSNQPEISDSKQMIISKMGTLISFFDETYDGLPSELDKCLSSIKKYLRNNCDFFSSWEDEQAAVLVERRKKRVGKNYNDRLLQANEINGK